MQTIAKTVVFSQDADICIGEHTQIMDYCVLGVKNPWNNLTKEKKRLNIGNKCIIYPWSILYEGSCIEDEVQLFERSLVGSLSLIGQKSRLLYGAQVHDNVSIGQSSIIAGFVADNCSIGSNCFIYGSLIHKHENRDVNKWDEIDEEGPIIEDNVFIGWGSIIIGNVTIGKGVTIKPNTVINNDVAPYKTIGDSCG